VLDTASGTRLDLDRPNPSAIKLEDIASALSKICRFGAQAREFYSVAQHAILVKRLVMDAGHSRLGLLALHHDSHEAFAGDIPTPLKQKIDSATTVYRDVCQRLDLAIADALGLDWPLRESSDWQVIKAADSLALRIEAARLLPNGFVSESQARSLPSLEEPLDSARAEAAFLQAHRTAVGAQF
jgi:uncharacterized protein